MGMGIGMASKARPTKPALKPVKKMQNFNWRRFLVTPAGATGKKDTVWDVIKEPNLKMEEIEDLFENKVSKS